MLLLPCIMLSFNTITSASATDRVTMQDGNEFTGTVLSSTVKFKTKYGEMEINTENIISFSMGTLILKDQSRLIGNFSSGNITIEVSNQKLDFPAIEVTGLTTKLANVSDERRPSTNPNQSLSHSIKLSRDDAKRILISENLVISRYWYFYTPGNVGTSKSIQITTDAELFLKDPYNFGSMDTLRSYWSCLENRNLARVERVKDNWLKLISEGRISLTEIGQKYLDKDLKFSFKVIVNEITGIQYVDKTAIKGEETKVAKVFFNGTVVSNDNPFIQCFESCWDIQSFLNEPYALFELFDDGWRFEEWNCGSSFGSFKKTSKEPTIKEGAKQRQEEINPMEEAKKQEITSLQKEGSNAIKGQNWNTAVQAYTKLLEINPENYDANTNIGTAYTMLDEFDLSINHLTKAQQLKPAEYKPHYLMSVAYARKGDKDRAIDSLRDAIHKGYKDLSVPNLEKDTNLPEDFKQDYRFKGLLGKLEINKLISDVQDANLFDIHETKLPYKYNEVWDAIDCVLKDQKEKITQSDKEMGFIITHTCHWSMNREFYRYYILAEKVNDTSTKLQLRLIVHNSISIPGEKIGSDLILKPMNKTKVNEKANKFLGKVKEVLEKK